MPNWVFNTIKINGKNEDIEKYLSDASKHENGKLYLSSWIPIPETFKKYDTTNHPNGERLEIGKPIRFWEEDSPTVTQELIDEYKVATKEQMEQYGVVGWRDYNCMTYGCKWDSRLEVESQVDGELTLFCETPWSPPCNFFHTMSERYPELTFNMSFDSAEGGFYGEYLFENGEMTVLEEEDYDFGAIEKEFYKEHPWRRLRDRIMWINYRCKARIRSFLCKRGLIKQDELPF